jgi:hypothetical protein
MAMNRSRTYRTVWRILFVMSIAVFFLFWRSGEQPVGAQTTESVRVYEALPDGPVNPAIGQKHRNPEDNTRYIFNGRVWVPYDKRADEIDYDKIDKDFRKAKGGRK